MSNRTTRSPSENRSRSGDGDGGSRALSLGSLAAVALSVATSALGYGPLPARMRIHWSLGGPYYGPEFAPAAVVLVGFPVLVAGVALGAHLLVGRLRASEAFATARPYDALAVLVTLVALLGTQAALVVANV